MEERQYHTRLIYLLFNTCSKVTRALLPVLIQKHQTCHNMTVDKFVKGEKKKIKGYSIGKRKYEILYPTRNRPTDINEWDIQLLCFIIKDILQPDWKVKADMNYLKEIRNQLCHGSNTRISKDDYEHDLTLLREINERLLKIIGDEKLTREIDAETESIIYDRLEIQKALFALQDWLEKDKDLLEDPCTLNEEQKQIIADLRRVLENRRNLTIPDTKLVILIRNCNPEEENMICRKFVDSVNSKVKESPILMSQGRDKTAEIDRIVEDTFKDFITEHRKPCGAELGCVIIYFKSETFRSMEQLWTKCVNGELSNAFGILQSYLRETYNNQIEIEIMLPENEFLDIIETMVNDLKDEAFEEKTKPTEAEEFADNSNELDFPKRSCMEGKIVAVKRQPSSVNGAGVEMVIRPNSLSHLEHMSEYRASGNLDRRFKKMALEFERELNVKDITINTDFSVLETRGAVSTIHTLWSAGDPPSVGSDEHFKGGSQSKEPEASGMHDEEIKLDKNQMELAEPAFKGANIIIVAPIWSDRPRITCRIIQEHMKMKGRDVAKVIFLVNETKMANQQREACQTLLPKCTSKVICGESQRSDNEYLKDFVDKRHILIVPARFFRDALINKEIEGIHIFSLIIFDECHHILSNTATAFKQIMNTYRELCKECTHFAIPQIVGLTASLGLNRVRNVDRAVENISHLKSRLEAVFISIVTDCLPDEKTVEVPKRKNDLLGKLLKRLMNNIETRMAGTQEVAQFVYETVPANKGSAQYTQWLSELWKNTAKLKSDTTMCFLDSCKFYLGVCNNALIIYNNACIKDALSYLDGKIKRWTNTRTMNDDDEKLQEEFEVLRNTNFNQCSINPKLETLQQIIIGAYNSFECDLRGIIFVKTMDIATAVVNWMKDTNELKIKNFNPVPFWERKSNADKKGMKKKDQVKVLNNFRDGKHLLIVATSEAEEDIDRQCQCNLVIRYDHKTSEISVVQFKGRERAKSSKYGVLFREAIMKKAIAKIQDDSKGIHK